VQAELRGPGLDNTSLTLATAPNAFLEIPPLRVAGDYVLSNVRLESNGEVLLRRQQGPGVEPIVIKVIDEILVTEVTSRPLSLQEIEERGIVLTEENFTVFEFVVGFVVESDPVKINFPVMLPRQLISPDELPRLRLPRFTPKIQAVQIPHLDIPNLMIGGFSLVPPPDVVGEPETPPSAIPGVIIIPGDVGFLNQFFSVLLMVSNAAPAGSGLTVSNLQAEIALPPGGDNLLGTGDDPLRLAQTQQGAQSVLPILRFTTTATGERVVSPDENFLKGCTPSPSMSPAG
jgi:hypothetical protein